MSCQNLREALAECLLRSDCVLRQNHTPKECLQEHLEELPDECKHLRIAFFECKRGMLDMRKRFRGIDSGQLIAPRKGDKDASKEL